MIKQLLGLVDRGGHVTPATAAAFQALAPAATLPWRTGEELARECNLIFDAGGRQVATVDEWQKMTDEEAAGIAAMIVVAVNTCGGFRAEPSPKGQKDE